MTLGKKHWKLGFLLDRILFPAQKWDFEGSFYDVLWWWMPVSVLSSASETSNVWLVGGEYLKSEDIKKLKNGAVSGRLKQLIEDSKGYKAVAYELA